MGKVNTKGLFASQLKDMKDANVDAMFSTNDGAVTRMDIPVASIDVRAQVRTDFNDDEDNSLAELAESIGKHGLIHPIYVRPIGKDRYELVAGERRLRASRQVGLTMIAASIRTLTDEEAADFQLAENIQRQNLKHFEILEKIERDIAAAGGGKAAEAQILAKVQKSPIWLFRLRQLRELPPQTQRLMKEGVSADLQVIGAVKQVEKHQPEKVGALIDKLKETRGKVPARDIAEAARLEAKPPSTREKVEAAALQQLASRATRGEQSAKQLASSMTDVQRDALQTLKPFRKRGSAQSAESLMKSVFDGIKKGDFDTFGVGALRLAAFLQGYAYPDAELEIESIFKVVKK